MLRDRILDVLTSGRPLDIADPQGRLILFHNAASLFGMLAVLIFVPINLLSGHRAIALMLLPVVGVALFNLWYMRRTARAEVASTLAAMVMFPVFIVMVVDGGIENTGPYWLGLLPIVTFFALGMRQGLAWNTAFALLLLGLAVFQTRGWLQTASTPRQLVLLTASYLVISMFCAIYEYFRAVTERALRRSQQDLRRQATEDALTGLPNRTLVLDRLAQGIESARRHRRRMALLFLDLDGFKDVNDRHGHETGDVVLRAVADRLRPLVRTSDTLGRYGGDEFVLLLPEIESEQVTVDIARRCVAAMAEPFMLDGRDVRLGVSIGIALYPDHGDSADALLCAADQAMYTAKRGHNGHHTATTTA